MAKLINDVGITVVHHEGKVYKPGKDGTFDVPDHIAPLLRPHGLRPEGETETTTASADEALVAANARIAELEAQLAPKKGEGK